MLKIGVLAFQGDVREHIEMLKKIGAEPIKIKLAEHLNDVYGLIMPGGESTTIGFLMKKYKVDKAIKERHKQGMPIYGTCAGAILLSKEIIGSNQPKLGLADISIKRNDYGRQIDSFETELDIKGIGKSKGVFIRAPVIKNIYNGVEILSEYKNQPVMVRQNNILITTFHPELANETRVHKYFLNMAQEYRQIREMQKDL
ncbi:pyridoxal 5'-phosphate synthase glutaminase subunit PdxT [Candidatus Woesearchaeota archaeon]|nr:pyridoxal 5'-phosphate synthase glutaminase subunit PdxT [Candidatus Woesearchaeota archaeon]